MNLSSSNKLEPEQLGFLEPVKLGFSNNCSFGVEEVISEECKQSVKRRGEHLG